MKARLFALFVALLMVGCGSPDLDDPEALDKILAEAIDLDKLQKRGKKGEELAYAPNEQIPFTGWAKEMWGNGQVKVLVQSKEGKVDGQLIAWYENGHKKGEGNFKDGKKDELNTAWYENGQKEFEENFKDGKLDSLATKWYENGQKKYENNYKDGEWDGLSTGWYENGQKSTEFNAKDGKLMSAVVWKPNGEKCPVTNIEDGDGIVVWYKDDGTESFRKTYKDGKPVED